MGGTYADQWNSDATQNGFVLPMAPQLVILSGEWDSIAETSDLMDYEVGLPELVAEALGELRASPSFHREQQDAGTVEMMEVDYGPRNQSYITLLPDTNVMISYLDMIDSLNRFLEACPDLSVCILLPGIVMSELDGLRKSEGRSCQSQAQDANRWAATELAKRGPVKGQRDSATMAPGGSWRRYYHQTGKENPDSYILDCVFHERLRPQAGKWIVLTLDQNCAAQCLANEIPVIKPLKSWSLEDLIRQAALDTPVEILPHHRSILDQMTRTDVGRGTKYPVAQASPHVRRPANGQVDWANAPDKPSRSTSRSAMYPSQLKFHEHETMPPSRGMDVDDDSSLTRIPTLPPIRDSRDDLQEQLVTFLVSVLPNLMKDSIAAHNQTRDQSMHAVSNSRRRPAKRTLPSISSTEWNVWPPFECVLFLADYPPPPPPPDNPSSRSKTKASPPPAFPEKVHSAVHSLASLVRKDRRGREFGRGDWERASTGLAALCPQVREPFSQAVQDVFEG